MVWLFVLLPLLVITSLFMYRFDGKKELMKFDLIQFLYAFVVVPLLYLWSKTFIFLLIKDELEVRLTVSDLFLIDTSISLIFFFLSSFVVIHSLTKSFNLKREKDPLYDLHELSEYFHLTLSHFVIFGGGLAVLLLVSLLNLFIPLPIENNQRFFYTILLIGVLVGFCIYLAVVNYRVATRKFRRIMKLFYGMGFITNVVGYLIVDPDFSGLHSMYWLSFAAFLTMVVMALFVSIDIHPQHQKKHYTITLATTKSYLRYVRTQLLERFR